MNSLWKGMFDQLCVDKLAHITENGLFKHKHLPFSAQTTSMCARVCVCTCLIYANKPDIFNQYNWNGQGQIGDVGSGLNWAEQEIDIVAHLYKLVDFKHHTVQIKHS